MKSLTPSPTLITKAYEAILEAICVGRLPAAARLNQDELAARLQISRQPVGQALTILKSQGFVRDTGRRGLIVAPLEVDFFLAIYQLREALDPLAARLAADRHAEPDLAAARKLVAEGRKAVATGVIDALIDTDLRFHMWIYRTAGNPLLVDTMGLYWNHLRRAMGEVLREPKGRPQVWDEHEKILRAIAARDGEAAEKHAGRHAREAARRVVGSLAQAALTSKLVGKQGESEAPPRRRGVRQRTARAEGAR